MAAGGELPAVMVAGRWKSPGMVSRYAEGTTAGRGAVARYHRNGQRGGVGQPRQPDRTVPGLPFSG